VEKLAEEQRAQEELEVRPLFEVYGRIYLSGLVSMGGGFATASCVMHQF
jgi:hypothetical protein